jgi:holo-[acyl-carrier protein] synthase
VGEYLSPELRHRVGVDVVSVARIRRLLADHPSAAAELFTPVESAYSAQQRRPADHLAARFAVKEAVFKALGIGLLEGMSWTDVEITDAPGGRPLVRLTGEAATFATSLGLRELEVSISHSGGIAIAQVLAVLEEA